MISKRKDRQKLLMTDELFDKLGDEYKEEKPTSSSVYKPVKEEDSVMDFLDTIPDIDEPSEPVRDNESKGGLGLFILFLLISLLSIATIVFILVKGGV